MIDLELDTRELPEIILDKVSGEDGVRCVFSKTDVVKVGTGTTTRKHVATQYFYVQSVGEDEFSARLVNESHVPTGEEVILDLNTLMRDYTPEIEFYEEKAVPAMAELEGHLVEGDKFHAAGKLYSAEDSYHMALGMDEQNLRALFNLGLIYLELGAEDQARDMMDQILRVRAAFDGKNEHLYNAFGIKLRKSGLYDEAVKYYTHAVDYVQDDENLFYNLARANYERNDWPACVAALERSHYISPKLKPVLDMFKIILTFSQKPDLCEREGKAPVPHEVVRQIRELLVMEEDRGAAQPLNLDDVSSLEGVGDAPEIGRARAGSVTKEVDELSDG